ncbi:MAG: o-succinylbenzoate synthase [Prochlorococcaceae cyanobacterium]
MAAATSDRFALQWRAFAFDLPRPLQTAHGRLAQRRGWLLRLSTASGLVGWGEAAPLTLGEQQAGELQRTAAAVAALEPSLSRKQLEAQIAAPQCPGALAFALGAALAEVDALVGAAAGGWQAAPAPAQLLPAGPAALEALMRAEPAEQTFKWKVAVLNDAQERAVLEQLLGRLGPTARLRLDANGHWDRSTAAAWADRLAAEPRLQWLEQPLAPGDLAGHQALAQRLPVALDESLQAQPQLRQSWRGWQVRRPSQEGDPRPLLAALAAGQPHLMLSTAFETGIGRRWLHHLAALQANGPTPAAPGLAPGWGPDGPLFSGDPQQVWEAAA